MNYKELDYEEFKQAVISEMKSHMSDEINNNAFSVVVKPVKNQAGITQETVTLETTRQTPAHFVAPSFALGAIYDGIYCKKWKGNLEKTIDELARALEQEYRSRWNQVAITGDLRGTQERVIEVPKTKKKTKYGPEDVFFCIVPQTDFVNVEGTVEVMLPGNLKLMASVDVSEGDKLKAIIISDTNDMKQNDLDLTDEEIMECAYKGTLARFPIVVSEARYKMYSATNTARFFMPQNELKDLARKNNADIIYYPLQEKGSMFEYLTDDEDVKENLQQAMNSYARILETEKNKVYHSEVLVYDRKADKIVTAREYIEEHTKEKDSQYDDRSMAASDMLKTLGRGM